ncbi:MAG: hypothetical protein KKB79_02700, partial [Nanoarchaeota archaeon]|nr:hypothetical protein [Nanoarchaeota archaeon]
DVEQKAKCEKMVALAIRCEYKEDEISCNELRAMEPKQGDSFAESFVPGFLKNLFKEKSYMIEYDIQPSDGVPEECWDDNDKPECKQYAHLKETKEDWDAYGNYIGKRPEKKEPTMQESVPECFDGDVFLEEKCGKITVVRTEDGLVNYIVEKDVDGIIEEFENKSEQNNYAPGTNANGSGVGGGYAPGTTANGTDGQMQVQSKAMQIKQQMNQITNQIASITYAPGTGPGGRGGVVIDGDGQDVVTSGGGNNFVSNDVADDGNGGYAPGTSAGGTQGDDVVSGGDNVVDSGTVDSGTVDGGSSNDVAGVDPGPDGIVGTIVDPDAIDD